MLEAGSLGRRRSLQPYVALHFPSPITTIFPSCFVGAGLTFALVASDVGLSRAAIPPRRGGEGTINQANIRPSNHRAAARLSAADRRLAGAPPPVCLFQIGNPRTAPRPVGARAAARQARSYPSCPRGWWRGRPGANTGMSTPSAWVDLQGNGRPTEGPSLLVVGVHPWVVEISGFGDAARSATFRRPPRGSTLIATPPTWKNTHRAKFPHLEAYS